MKKIRFRKIPVYLLNCLNEKIRFIKILFYSLSVYFVNYGILMIFFKIIGNEIPKKILLSLILLMNILKLYRFSKPIFRK